MKRLGEYGVAEQDFEITKDQLSKKFGQEPSNQDVLWSLFNQLILKTKDLHTLKMIYYEMALFLNEEGKDCFAVSQLSRKMELTKYKQEGVKKVQILAAGPESCEQCQQMEDKILTINEALEKMLIPLKECTHVLHDKKRGFCRCCYVPIIDLWLVF